VLQNFAEFHKLRCQIWQNLPRKNGDPDDDDVVVGYYRRGDLASSLMPATYFVHGLAGYTPTMMSAHTLPTAAFLSAGVDPLTYATIPYAPGAAAAAQAYDAMTSNVGSDAATTSELSPGSTQNGVVDSNGAGNFAPPGYGSRHFCQQC